VSDGKYGNLLFELLHTRYFNILPKVRISEHNEVLWAFETRK